MGSDRSSSSGFTVVAAAALDAAVAYWILSAQETPTLPFAIAQYTLLASALIGGLDGFKKCRARR